MLQGVPMLRLPPALHASQLRNPVCWTPWQQDSCRLQQRLSRHSTRQQALQQQVQMVLPLQQTQHLPLWLLTAPSTAHSLQAKQPL